MRSPLQTVAKGLFLEPLGLVHAPSTSDTAEVRWYRPDDGLLTGTVFSDGSGPTSEGLAGRGSRSTLSEQRLRTVLSKTVKILLSPC